jgi:ApaG protein
VSDTTTCGIRVVARGSWEPARSAPSAGRWFFSDRIRIENIGDQTAQLLSRLWIPPTIMVR